MNLTKMEFELLVMLQRLGRIRLTQQQIADRIGCSVGIVNRSLRRCRGAGAIELGEDRSLQLTPAGLDLLEPYRVKNAIILAAGFSERLAPVSLSVPKPLVSVNGTRIIDTLIDALLAAGIDQIAVVTGYRGEAFRVLRDKYPQVRLIDNPLYNQSGNITTLAAARDQLVGTYVCDADLLVKAPEVIRRYEYHTCFFGCPVPETDDWCFTRSGARIRRFGIGGEGCYKAVFLTHISQQDAPLLQENLQSMLTARGGREHHWFDALFRTEPNRIPVYVKECGAEDVAEIDTMEDLIGIDASYRDYLNNEEKKGL